MRLKVKLLQKKRNSLNFVSSMVYFTRAVLSVIRDIRPSLCYLPPVVVKLLQSQVVCFQVRGCFLGIFPKKFVKFDKN